MPRRHFDGERIDQKEAKHAQSFFEGTVPPAEFSHRTRRATPLGACGMQCRLTPHEAWVVAHATHWTACTWGGREHAFHTARHPTRAAAIADAERRATCHGSGTMIYAVFRSHQALADIIEGMRQ